VNKDVVGFIKVNGTEVSYPVVQTKDNDYYLKHSFSKKNNSAGWVFLDYKNNNIFNDKNTIIYAHSRKDGSMFGTLKNVLTKKWIADKSNHIIQITNEKNSYQAVVFSVYKIKTSNDYLQINYIDNQFIEKALKRSIYNFSQDINKNDKILTLTTCASSKEKIVLHAKLID
ncbi:MAG: class B sortase, partial [Tenericutes bacterium]|nr:class B sortase [Mycoplasmatota bacterium]